MGKLDLFNSILHKSGFEVIRYNKATSCVLRRKAIFEKYGIDLIIDVGANTGIFGNETRSAGYRGRIVSFEPLTEAFDQLKLSANKDQKWHIYNLALGAENGKQSINVSANSHSSSILDISETHTNAETSASYIGKQAIEVRTLDSLFEKVKGAEKEVFLKIDTQGFELSVLSGAVQALPYINTIQLEMSLRSLYNGQPLYTELMNFLHARNYLLIDIEPGFADPNSGTLLQFDGIFRKTEFL